MTNSNILEHLISNVVVFEGCCFVGCLIEEDISTGGRISIRYGTMRYDDTSDLIRYNTILYLYIGTYRNHIAVISTGEKISTAIVTRTTNSFNTIWYDTIYHKRCDTLHYDIS